MRYYWKSQYLRALDDEVIDVLVALNEASPSTPLHDRLVANGRRTRPEGAGRQCVR